MSKIGGTAETFMLMAGAAVCFGLYKLYGVWMDGGNDADDVDREDEN